MSETTTLREYLDMMVTMHGKMKAGRPQGFNYSCIEDFVLDRGREYDLAGAVVTPGTPHNCFWNARAAARKNRWAYVEGFSGTIIPVLHGWCVDRDGRVHEVTWDTLGFGYYGVEIPLKDTRLDSCYLDDWKRRWPALRLPRKEDPCRA